MARRWLILAAGAVLMLAGCGAASVSVRDSGDGRKAKDRQPTAQLGALAIGWKTNFSKHTVPLSEFQSGGPGKDGIPAIDRPRFAPLARAAYLKPQEPVISVVVNGQARAYPLQILIWHEIVNDRIGGVPVTVTFCPLCNTAIAFDRRVGGRTLDFGTTGNLRNSDLVMYDRQTESWWQQFGGESVVGRYAGTRLEQIPARIVSWREFAREHRDGVALTRDTGFSRPYGANPYTGYDDAGSPPFFPTKNLSDNRLPPKERVVYVEFGGQSAAVPFSALAKEKVIRLTVDGHRLVVRFTGDAASALDSAEIARGRRVGTAEVLENGKLVPFSEPFWFAVAAFQPKVVLKS